MTSELDWQRLGAALRSRMSELGLTLRSIGPAGGPSESTVGKLLRANPEGVPISPDTVRKLEAVLQWEERSVADTLAGGDPRPVRVPGRIEVGSESAGERTLIQLMNGIAALPEKDRLEVLALVEAKRKLIK